MTTPTFLVAGGARSGTTALTEGLKTHSDVFITRPKEPHYFALQGSPAAFKGPGDNLTINRVAVTDRKSYLNLYPTNSAFRAFGDGSVSTLYSYKRAIPEVLSINPAMRIIVLLREPVARAYSSFQYMRGRGFEPCADFLTALDDEPRRRRESWQHLWHYAAMSRYADAVQAFQTYMGKNRVGIWFYDDLVADYTGLVQRVLRFLELPMQPSVGVGIPGANISGEPRSVAFQRGMLSAKRSVFLRGVINRLSTYELRERIRRAAVRPEPMPQGAREMLAPLFANDLDRLSALVPIVDQPTWLSSHQ